MTTFLAYTLLILASVGSTYGHFTYGWGLSVQSWPAVIGFGVLVPIFLLVLRVGMEKK